jgi:hypothetical protein
MPDAGGTIRDAKVAVNDRGDAPKGPEFIAEALGTRALAEEGDELLPLVGSEFGWTPAGRGFGLEACLGMLGNSIPPASHGTGRGLDVASDLTDAPAGLQQGDGDAAANFELDGCAFGSHETCIGIIGLGL